METMTMDPGAGNFTGKKPIQTTVQATPPQQVIVIPACVTPTHTWKKSFTTGRDYVYCENCYFQYSI